MTWFARPSQQFTSLIALNDSGVLKAATGNPFSYTRISPELCSQLTAKCASNENASGYLEITVHGNPADPRTDDIIGDIGARERPSANWGLHLVDANIAMGNLLDIVTQQTKAYQAKK